MFVPANRLLCQTSVFGTLVTGPVTGFLFVLVRTQTKNTVPALFVTSLKTVDPALFEQKKKLSPGEWIGKADVQARLSGTVESTNFKIDTRGCANLVTPPGTEINETCDLFLLLLSC